MNNFKYYLDRIRFLYLVGRITVVYNISVKDAEVWKRQVPELAFSNEEVSKIHQIEW